MLDRSSISRRFLLKVIAILALSTSSLSRFEVGSAFADVGSVGVHEVTMILPDLICVEVRDPPVGHIGLVAVPSPPDPGAYGKWLDRSMITGGVGTDKVLLLGADKDWLKVSDVRATKYLDRAAAELAGDYGTIGGLTVTTVYRKSQPYDWGEVRGDTSIVTTKAASSKHFLYLQLSGNLAPGTHTISFPEDTEIADYKFTFNDRATRFKGIKCNQFGFAPGDAMKFAYLSEWIPGYGIEGRIDFSSIAEWHIIDHHDLIQWSGSAPALRVTATEPEVNSRITPANSRLTSTTQPTRVLTNYTNANPCVLTYTGDDLGVGMVIRIEGVRCNNTAAGGAADSGNALNSGQGEPVDHTITAVDNSNPLGKLATIGALNRSASSATIIQNGVIYETQAMVNRAATNVYGLDFSSFEPAIQGIYRIYIEGYGVSHPFYIDDAVWYNVAGNMAAGEYHHRHGVACDGRFGYTRPAGFDASTQPIYENLVPYAFSSEIGVCGAGDSVGGIETAGQTTSPMHTAVTVNYTIGHHDAGDHDSRLGSHVVAYYGYLDFYDQFPKAAEATDWNIPTMEELYPADSTYEWTSILPDCLQQAMFSLHGYIAGMTAAGDVRGGMNWSSFSTLTPSWLVRSANGSPATTHTIFVYGPDHISSIILCPLLAKMAVCLRKWDARHSATTFTTLAQYYEDLATLTWNRATLIYDGGTAYADGSTENVTAARDEVYGAYKTQADILQPGVFVTRFANRQDIGFNASARRLFAAAAMFRLTGDAIYGDIVTGSSLGSNSDMIGYPSFGAAAWEYINATLGTPNTAKQAYYKTAVTDVATARITSFVRSDIGFKSLKARSSASGFGYDGTDWQGLATILVASYILSERDSPGSGVVYRQVLEDGWHYGLGANLTGKSFTTGLGTDVVSVLFHNDSMASGQPPPKGVMIYGTSGKGLVASFEFDGNAPSNWLTMNSTESFTADFEHDRKISPTRHAWPQAEHFYESPGLIGQTEYVFGGSIGPQQWVASVLWAGNGKLSIKSLTGAP